ncbi:MAG TPA: bifunctional phosphoglucose/phosphomannose isomerase [Patescibacteria group bacterium]|jgi:glucose/mannose-6-phosphate isomerase|nr:bifunctional phosphoglucose/phosphomannose isomerase [Patescibacteria group bacterium]
MLSLLDQPQRIKQFDSQNALGVAATEPSQLGLISEIINPISAAENDDIPKQVIVTGMGGSPLPALLAKTWLNLPVPFEIIRGYDLPAYVGSQTLVIAASYSGNTEETLSALAGAENRQAKIGVITSGGKLLEIAKTKNYPHVVLPADIQPRMTVFYGLRALVRFFESFGMAKGKFDELGDAIDWLNQEVQQWTADKPYGENLAKQLAEQAVGKTTIIYAGPLMAPVAYKWKISFNENAKNVAFWNELPEFNHNEFIGWSSHPIEKPFAVFDLISSFEHPRVLKRFEVTDRLLSGMRPKATSVQMQGDSILKQMLWGTVLADFVTIYLAVLNGVNPTPVDLVEKLKTELLN